MGASRDESMHHHHENTHYARTCVPVPKKKETGLPTSAPLAQSPPVLSQKARICAAGVPKRVGKPKMKPSASTRSSGLMMGMLCDGVCVECGSVEE